MPRFTVEEHAAMKRSILEIAEKYYVGKLPTVEPEAPVTPRPKVEKITKSPATLVAEKNAVEPEKQVVVKPENVIEVPQPIMPKSVAAMIGETFNGIKVLSYNVEASQDASKGRALPHVNAICPKCEKEFVANAYNIKGGQKKHCGCLRK